LVAEYSIYLMFNCKISIIMILEESILAWVAVLMLLIINTEYQKFSIQFLKESGKTVPKVNLLTYKSMGYFLIKF